MSIPCGISFAIWGDIGRCNALEVHGNEYACGLVTNPSNYVNIGGHDTWRNDWFGKMVGGMLGIGMGCCSTMEGYRIAKQLRDGLAERGILKHGIEGG